MAATVVNVRKASVWIVEAKSADDCSRWQFDDEEKAQRFSNVAQKWYCARCPTCEMKDIVNITLGDLDTFEELIVSCGSHDCDFAKRIVMA